MAKALSFRGKATKTLPIGSALMKNGVRFHRTPSVTRFDNYPIRISRRAAPPALRQPARAGGTYAKS